MRVSGKPQRAPCPSCQALAFVGWRDGILETVWVDAVALTPLDELLVHQNGLETFCHWGGPSGARDTSGAQATQRRASSPRCPPADPPPGISVLSGLASLGRVEELRKGLESRPTGVRHG